MTPRQTDTAPPEPGGELREQFGDIEITVGDQYFNLKDAPKILDAMMEAIDRHTRRRETEAELKGRIDELRKFGEDSGYDDYVSDRIAALTDEQGGRDE